MIQGPQRRNNESDRFLVGDPYANNNPFLVSISIIWHKYHNLLANELHLEQPELTDDDIFTRIKARIVGHLQEKFEIEVVFQLTQLFLIYKRKSRFTTGYLPTYRLIM